MTLWAKLLSKAWMAPTLGYEVFLPKCFMQALFTIL